jgi:hypothetical protein
MLTRTALILAVALAICASGCRRQSFDTPVDAYLSIARALQKGEGKVAWNALSSRTQELLQARARALSEESGGAVREEPAALFFGASYDRAPVKEVRVVRQEGDMAVLAVVPEEGEVREVRMVREADGWKLDATDLLTNEAAQ